jgi:hypothetical protein
MTIATMTDEEFKIKVVELCLLGLLYKNGKCAIELSKKEHCRELHQAFYQYAGEKFFVTCVEHKHDVIGWNLATEEALCQNLCLK